MKKNIDNYLTLLFLVLYSVTCFLLSLNPFVGIFTVLFFFVFAAVGVVIPASLFGKTTTFALTVGAMSAIVLYIGLIINLELLFPTIKCLEFESIFASVILLILELVVFICGIEKVAKEIYKKSLNKKQE